MVTAEKESAKGKVAETRVSLIELGSKTMRVKIRGISPLITHAWSEKAVKMMADAQQKKGKKGREAKDPNAEFEGCFYKNEDGIPCVPSSAIKKAMVTAATAIDDKVNFPKTKIRQAVFIQGHLLPIISKEKPTMRCDPVRVGKGSADLRYRPEWKEWAIDLIINYNSQVLSAEQVINIIDLAGFGVGICEWRPERDGEFGRFEVAK